MNPSPARRGILAMLDRFPGATVTRTLREFEALGYDSFWLPELFGREPIATASYLLAQTEKLVIASGIANIYVRDPHAMAQAAQTLAEFSGGRFLLGLGVSNVGLNTARGHRWLPPLDKMTAYLDALDQIEVQSAAPAAPAPRILAAHGPQLQALGAARCDGIVTYLMTPEHTRRSRARIGPDSELNVVCAMVAEQDPVAARRIARSTLAIYLLLDYYHREWRKLGFADADFVNGGSDALIDKLVGWGDAAALEAHLAAHVSAGANRVIVMSLDAGGTTPGMKTWEVLAPGP